jgi:hypothetical protein
MYSMTKSGRQQQPCMRFTTRVNSGFGGCSSDGRALQSHCRGQGFDSPQLHQGFQYLLSRNIITRQARLPSGYHAERQSRLACSKQPSEERLIYRAARRRARTLAKKRRKVLSEMYRNFATAAFGLLALSMSAISSHSCGVGCQRLTIGSFHSLRRATATRTSIVREASR